MASGVVAMESPVVDTEYVKEIDKARRDLRAPIASEYCSPTMLRLALWVLACSRVTGGPTIDFVPGRKVLILGFIGNKAYTNSFPLIKGFKVSPKESRLPDSKQGPPHLRDIFYQIGLSDKGIVALSGGNTLALLDDPEFRCYVELYAKDEDAFFRDYAESHKKLSELGFTPHSSASKAITNDPNILAQSAFEVAVAAAVVILSYLYEVRKRAK
ncbi:hypothetical protein HS088_TW22G01517 [Tripterygium wilfordii]|uniref:Uncharacterized protein n=1 Tax=Tripterygium wilfordii TaxID=458696 RepID=A0A7J7C0Y9_TRIWF|nr:hypothetical protein HS088_TW22G01517 [Tripterygium wilfordii]